MLYVVTALYCEAKPWILTYSLKKEMSSSIFQIFYNESITLIISKQGKINAALAVNELFHRYPPTESDFLINVGIAGCEDITVPIGSGFLCDQLLDYDTGMTYYPDLLFHNNFKEASLRTVSKPMKRSKDDTELHTITNLYDMEACGVYIAAMMYLKQHQILFYKVVSDHLAQTLLSPDNVSTLIQDKLPELSTYIHSIVNALVENSSTCLDQEEINLIQDVAHELHFSVTMTYQFKQLILYGKLSKQNITNRLKQLLADLHITPCRSKKEGKEYFEQLKHELI